MPPAGASASRGRRSRHRVLGSRVQLNDQADHTSDQCDRFVHPALRPLLHASSGQPSFSQLPVRQAREQLTARAASRPKGPDIEHVRDLSAPGPNGEIPLRLYRPRGARGAVVAFHGGGWMMGSRDTFDATARNIAHESGAAVISVDYRLAPEFPFPAAVEDAWAALCWVVAESYKLGIDGKKLAVIGESAGGNLAAVVCLMARDAGRPSIALQVLVYPAVDARLETASLDEFAEGYLQTKRDVQYAYRTYGVGTRVSAEDWRVSPLLAASHASLPPALIISAEQDNTRDDSENYARCLLEAGVSTTHVRYAHMVHTFFGMRGIVPQAQAAQCQAAAAIRRALEGAGT